MWKKIMNFKWYTGSYRSKKLSGNHVILKTASLYSNKHCTLDFFYRRARYVATN